MNIVDYFALSPYITLFVTALLLLLFQKRGASAIVMMGLALALYLSCISPASQSPFLTPWLSFDLAARFFSIFFLSTALIVCLIALPFFTQFEQKRAEFYFFLTSSVFGLMLISAAQDFLTLFLGLETLSIALYVLCGYVKTWANSSEASFKYFLMGSISSSFLLFGIALFYGATGTTRLDAVAQGPLFLAGIALISLSLLFKAAVVPMHIWAPDVYAGAPTPVTAFMAVATKAGAFAALIRIFLLTYKTFDPIWYDMIGILTYPTLIFANFVAMRQNELRRFFAYSGISHAGFLLIPLAAASPESGPAMLFYLIVYAASTLGAFAVLAFVDDKSEGAMLSDLKGLVHTAPFSACILALCLVTLAGLPPSVGFFAKFYILKVGFQAGYYGLVIVGLLTTILSAYYYLRIVAVMFSGQSERGVIRSRPAMAAGMLCFAAIVALSIYPGFVMSYLQDLAK